MSRFPAPAEALEEHVAIIGKTGAGKTYTAKGFAEDLLREGSRFCVIDPTGVWYGLKSSSDGESEGFAVVVFGGDHGDVPLREEDAEKVAEIVATTATPCVLDVSAFPSLASQKRFMADFAEHVFRLNREALHLFVDEADAFMPQRPAPDEQIMLGRWDTIARRGRSRGFRLTLITQRPAVLNKNALSQVGTLIALKLTSPQDRKAVGDWIEGNADKAAGKEILASLPGLDRGEGWVWSPGLDVLDRVRFPLIETWDSSRTPGKGEIHREAKALARADVAGILAKLSTPARQAPGSMSLVPDGDLIEAAEKRGYDRGLADAARELSALTGHAAQSLEILDEIRLIGEKAAALSVEIRLRHPAAAMRAQPVARAPDKYAFTPIDVPDPSGGRVIHFGTGEPPRPPIIGKIEPEEPSEALFAGFPAPQPKEAARAASELARGEERKAERVAAAAKLSPAGERMLQALARFSPDTLTRRQLGTLGRCAPQGGAFAMALKALKDLDWIEDRAGRLALTPEGAATALDLYRLDGLRHAGERFDMWRTAVDDPAARRILDALLQNAGKATRANLAGLAGYAAGGGAFAAGLKILRDNELLTTVRENGVQLETSELARLAAIIKEARHHE